MTRLHANLLLSLVAIVWASAFVAQSLGMKAIGPVAFTGVRFLLGALVVLPLALWEWRRRPKLGLPALATRDWLPASCGLGLLLGLGAVMQQIGIVSTTVTNAGFLTALYVPLVPLLSLLLLREPPHWSVWPGGLACLLGAFLLSGAHQLELHPGDAWVIASALPWALHVLFVGRVADRLHAPFLVACTQFAVVGVANLAWALPFEPFTWPQVQAAAGPIAYTGIVSVGLAFTAQVVAQRSAQAADAAIILSSETVFAALFGAWWLGERLNAQGLLGCALMLAALLAVQLLPLVHNRLAGRREVLP
ncbi:DMT family transporter [Inhella sp.]|uniref:DMT family transporter n=1 Tax=Inhella sp. TaxID=1921806 RepID=UPI0035B09BA0